MVCPGTPDPAFLCNPRVPHPLPHSPSPDPHVGWKDIPGRGSHTAFSCTPESQSRAMQELRASLWWGSVRGLIPNDKLSKGLSTKTSNLSSNPESCSQNQASYTPSQKIPPRAQAQCQGLPSLRGAQQTCALNSSIGELRLKIKLDPIPALVELGIWGTDKHTTKETQP